MLSTTSYVFSNDSSASDFRRAVRRQVASRAEYALPGAGASAQEVQQAYLRHLEAQSRGAQQALPQYTATTPEQAEQAEEAPPVYTATDASSTTTPTASLNTLLYANIYTPPSPPAYEDFAAPPSYEDLSACPTIATSTLSNSTNNSVNVLSHQNINALFAGATSATHRTELNNTAIQALNLVVGRDGSVLPPREEKEKGSLARIEGKRQGRRETRGLRRV
jgi:hypothetical protein